jgi:hypothetical protein
MIVDGGMLKWPEGIVDLSVDSRRKRTASGVDYCQSMKALEVTKQVDIRRLPPCLLISSSQTFCAQEHQKTNLNYMTPVKPQFCLPFISALRYIVIKVRSIYISGIPPVCWTRSL